MIDQNLLIFGAEIRQVFDEILVDVLVLFFCEGDEPVVDDTLILVDFNWLSHRSLWTNKAVNS